MYSLCPDHHVGLDKTHLPAVNMEILEPLGETVVSLQAFIFIDSSCFIISPDATLIINTNKRLSFIYGHRYNSYMEGGSWDDMMG